MIDYSILIQSPVFKGLSLDDSKGLFAQIHYQIKKYEKDEIVAYAEEEVKNLLIVLSGSVRGEMIDYSGKVVKIEDIEAPRALASAFLFGKDNKFPVTATANTKTNILAIPVSEFLKLLQLNTRLLQNCLNNMSTRAQFLSQKLQFLSFKTIKEKVAHYILQKADNKFHSFELKNTQQQLADMFGVTRPSLARVLGDMQDEGLIQIEKKTVTLLNNKGLNKLLRNG